MPLNPDHSLSPASIEVLLERLGGQPPAGAIVEDDLARFALGCLDASAQEGVIAGLVANPAARKRLAELLAEVESMRLLPAAEAAASPLWKIVAQELRRGFVSVSAAMAGAVRALGYARQTPAFATVRGGEIEAEINRDGDLKVFGPAEGPLYLADPGGEGLLIGKPPEGEITIEGFGATTGLKPGFLPSEYFHDAPATSSRYVFLEDRGEARAVEIWETPSVRDGVLRIALAGLPPLTRHDGDLLIGASVGTTEIALGRVPMSPWPPEGRTLEIPVPGMSESTILTASILQFRIMDAKP